MLTLQHGENSTSGNGRDGDEAWRPEQYPSDPHSDSESAGDSRAGAGLKAPQWLIVKGKYRKSFKLLIKGSTNALSTDCPIRDVRFCESHTVYVKVDGDQVLSKRSIIFILPRSPLPASSLWVYLRWVLAVLEVICRCRLPKL
jgi:hypothetical protein